MSKLTKKSNDGHAPDYIKIGPLEFHPVVFPVSALVILVTTITSAIFSVRDKINETTHTYDFFAGALETIATNFGWFYILVANVFLLVTGYMIFSKVGRVRLGGRHTKPDYSYGAWFAMLFSAGMGIGLMFFSVAEPMYHFGNPPGILPPASPGAAREAMAVTFYHWGLHAWGIYAMVGCAIAFFAYNKGLPLTIRSVFQPILGDRVKGPIGHVIDILAVIATLFGVATSLGLGVLQVNSGLNYLMPDLIPAAGSEGGSTVQLLLIAVITLAATASVVSGLDKGIKILSQSNLVIAGCLMLLVLVVGPTAYLFDSLIQNIGHYIGSFIELSSWTESYRIGEDASSWQHGWTIFYWGWWISWSPFVGMFIARISRGRTVREFALGVLLVPTLVTFIWLSVFGNSAIYQELAGDGGILNAVLAEDGESTALFRLFEQFPATKILSGLAVIVVVTFFVTSSDSGSLVIDTITGGGHPHPPVIQKIFWAVLEGAVAAALLLAGGLEALQAAAITTGLPFAVVLLVMSWCLIKGLRRERRDNVRARIRARRAVRNQS